MKFKTIKSLIVISVFLFVSTSYAQDSNLDKGLIAFDKKDFKLAVKELTPYAEQGNCLAQFAVGFAYGSETAVRNDSLALHWLELAAEQKQVKAMGPLAVTYFSSSKPDSNIKAYMWAMLAAEYDPVQQFTTARTLIKRYLKEGELETANKLISLYKERWKNKPNCE